MGGVVLAAAVVVVVVVGRHSGATGSPSNLPVQVFKIILVSNILTLYLRFLPVAADDQVRPVRGGHCLDGVEAHLVVGDLDHAGALYGSVLYCTHIAPTATAGSKKLTT